MNSLSSLFLPLLGGFLVLQAVPRTNFYLRKQGGYQVFLWSATAGACLLVAARASLLAWSRLDVQVYPEARALVQALAPFPFSGTLVSSFFLGLVAWGAFRGAELVRPDWAGNLMRSGLSRAARQDELLELQLRAIDAKAPIQLTLKSRKVYVGWVVSTEGLRPDMGFLKLVPTSSGYRTQDDLSFLLTEAYEKAGEILGRFEEGLSDEEDANELARLERFIRTEEIVSACFFDDEEYERHEMRYLEAMELEASEDDEAEKKTAARERTTERTAEMEFEGGFPSPAFRKLLDWLWGRLLRRLRRG